MGKRVDQFFNGSPKFMRFGFLGFVIAAIGVGGGFAFSIDYGPNNVLFYLAFGLAVIGVAIGFIAIVWGLTSIMRPNK